MYICNMKDIISLLKAGKEISLTLVKIGRKK